MLAAKDWQKYEEGYLKYGVNLSSSAKVEEMRAERKKKAKSTSIKMRPRGKMIAIILVLFTCLCGITMVWLNAYQSDINYQIYLLSQEARGIEGEISNLKVNLNSENHLDEIKEYASWNLGMTDPGQNQYVYVGDIMNSPEVDGYAEALAAQQRGIAVQKDYTLTEATMDLFG